MSSPRALLLSLAAVASCAAYTPTFPPEPSHELHLPPVGPAVTVAFDGKSTDVPLASLPQDGSAASLLALWKAVFPAEDVATLHFDLLGSDGFHPASRPACARPLTGADMAAGRIDVVTHDVSYDDALKLPGCYRVKAVVRLEATR